MDNNFAWSFDANAVAPRQGGGAHPVGNKFPFRITNVEINPTKDNSGGMLVVELTSDAGSIKNRYNLWNQNDTARKIAQEQLSALCHAVGIFQIGARKGQELIGGRGLMDIGFQKGHEPSAEKPEGGYVEIKKVYTAAGLEPGSNNQGNGNTATPTGNAQSAGNPAGSAQGQPQANGASPSNQPQQWGGEQQAQPNAAQAQPNNNAGWGGNGGQAPTNNPPWS